MHKYIMTIAASAAFTVLAGAASATTLTFDSTADCATAEVSITGGAGNEACQLGTSPNNTSALVRSTPRGDSFWTATFASLVSGVSVDLGDFNADEDRLFVRAFDSSNVLLEEALLDITAQDVTMHSFSLAAIGIKTLTFGITGDLGTGSGIYADNLTFEPSQVPLPAAGLMLLAAVGGLGAMRRRRK